MIGLVFPLKIEMKSALRALASKGCSMKQGEHQFYWNDQKDMVGRVCGHGKVDFALGCQDLLVKCPEISQLIAIGTAGSLCDELNLGDVIVAREIVEHDYKANSNWAAEPPVFKTDESFRPREGLSFDSFHWQLGRLASGDEDILDGQRAQQLVDQFSAQAVAWESAGGARAAKMYECSYSEIRGISDRCSSATTEDFAQHLPQAIENAITVILSLAKDLDETSRFKIL